MFSNTLNNNRTERRLQSALVVLGTSSLVINYLLHEQVHNVFLFVFQLLLVLGSLFTGRFYLSLCLHLVFLSTAITIPLDQFTNPGDSQFGLYNYPKLKLIGPLALSQLISFIMLVLFFYKSVTFKYSKNFNVLFVFFISLIVIGNIGAVIHFLNNSELNVKSYLYYMVYLCSCVMYLLLACILLQSKLRDSFSNSFLKITLVAPIVSGVMYFFGFSMGYGNEKVAIATELIYFWPFVFLSRQIKKLKVLSVISLFFFLYVFATGALGGKGVMMIMLTAFVASLYYARVLLTLAVFIGLAFYFFNSLNIEQLYQNESLKLFIYKVESAFLLIWGLFSERGFEIIPVSPRIRIYEVLLTIETWKYSLASMIIGNGFGGYFSDTLSLFNGIDLRHSYPSVEVQLNKFSRPHDTFPTVLFLHGFLGVFLFFCISAYFFMKSKSNKLYLSFIPFIILAFYYNHQFALIGIVLLLISEIRVKREH